MSWLAAGLSVIAMLLWRLPDRWLVRARLGGGSSVVTPRVPALAAIGLVLLVVTRLPGPRIVVAVTLLGLVVFAVRQARAVREHQRIRARRQATADVLALMAAELRSGQVPARMLAGLSRDHAFLETAARAADLGADVSTALCDAAAAPGREVLRDVGAAWQVAERSGAPLATVLGRLAQTVRDDHDLEREVQAGVAPARATGRLMAVLPAVALVLGSGLGGSPIAIVTSTWPGSMCAAAGCALACLGVVWIERIVSSAERQP